MTEDSTYEERQRTHVKVLNMRPEVDARLQAYADANNMSASEAAREVIAAYVDGEPIPHQEGRSKRRSIWVTPEMWARFVKKAETEEVSKAHAFEVTFEEWV